MAQLHFASRGRGHVDIVFAELETHRAADRLIYVPKVKFMFCSLPVAPVSCALAAHRAGCCPCQLWLCEVVTSCLVSHFVSESPSTLPKSLCGED